MMDDYGGNMTCQEITRQTASALLSSCDTAGRNYRPLGRFYLREGRRFIGIDNSTGNAWTEEFPDLKLCIAWLKGQQELPS
ncbi:hypothetical protein [Flavonifractor sp. An306]|uniref:hypothetical protein n=2 Tax=Flavonifractor TaxID=946234 RepID=UPI00174B5EBA|nr:hypothetical protein [Flavonifractor sp. An306]